MKNNYTAPLIDIIDINEDDVIATSGFGNDVDKKAILWDWLDEEDE